MVGIIGKGFGLYGYLPAFVELGYQVGVLEDSKTVIKSRSELAHLSDNISYFSSERNLFEICDKIVLATDPLRQESYVETLLNQYSIKNFFLEKPITVNPSNTQLLIKKLQNHNTNFNVGFNFFYTVWFENFKELILNKQSADILIKWDFMAYHIKNDVDTWKKTTDKGGGLINFYGIHLISILAAFDFDLIESKKYIGKDQIVLWKAIFVNHRTCKVEISLNINSTEEGFSIYNNQDKYFLTHLKNPFSNDNLEKHKRDPRIDNLKQMISSNNRNTYSSNVDLIQKTNQLLSKVLISRTVRS